MDEEDDESNDDLNAYGGGGINESNTKRSDPSDITIPTFKEFVATHGDDDLNNADESSELTTVQQHRKYSSKEATSRVYESFSIGVDLLNRYLLKRVEDEESLDELVKVKFSGLIDFIL